MTANTVNAWRGVESKKSLAREALDWQINANCVGEPLSTFFPEGPAQEAATEAQFQSLCGGCSVAAQCLDYSIAQPERHGRWGGLNESDRAAERRRRMRKGLVPKKPAARKRKSARKMTPPKQMQDGTGSARRLRAATAEGRLIKTFSQMSGVPETTLSKVRSGAQLKVSPECARRIADAYPRVLALVHQVHRVPLQAAAERGWHGPDAWTEATIDDPDALPLVCEPAA